MSAVAPPRRTQLLFWSIGRRLEPMYRPWVAEQIMRPDYARRRLWPMIAIQLVFIVIPQTLFALADHSRLRLIIPAALIALYLFSIVNVMVRRAPPNVAAQRRLLAYHGVTADGRLTVPLSAWGTNPLGKSGLALLCAQVLVFSSGVAVAADRIAAQRACHVPPATDAAALDAFVGRPVSGPAAAAFGAPPPIVPVGAELVAAREVDSGLDGVHFMAAYARDASGRLVGPGVWRVLDASTFLNIAPRPDISAQDVLARQITPSTGYGGSSPEDPAIRKARDCAKTAA